MKASVWHSAVCVMRTRTSPAPGGSTMTSSTDSALSQYLPIDRHKTQRQTSAVQIVMVLLQWWTGFSFGSHATAALHVIGWPTVDADVDAWRCA